MTPQRVEFEEPVRQIGFKAHSKEELIKNLYGGGSISRGGKLIPKSKIININNRKEDEQIRSVYNALQEARAIEFIPSRGYYALSGLNEALRALNTQ